MVPEARAELVRIRAAPLARPRPTAVEDRLQLVVGDRLQLVVEEDLARPVVAAKEEKSTA